MTKEKSRSEVAKKHDYAPQYLTTTAAGDPRWLNHLSVSGAEHAMARSMSISNAIPGSQTFTAANLGV